MTAPTHRIVDWSDDTGRQALLGRAEELLHRPARAVLGIAGAPGAGKSTISEWLVATLAAHYPGQVALLPLDAYHLAQTVIERRGDAHRKGAPDTFDVHGYLDMLELIHRTRDRTLYAPEFRRSINDAVAGAVEVGPQVRLVVTEGNYLLLDQTPWSRVRELLDESWFVQLEQSERIRRLTARHLQFDGDPAIAQWRATVNDEQNACLVTDSSTRSTLVIRHTETPVTVLDTDPAPR